jgi:hypothetical protein
MFDVSSGRGQWVRRGIPEEGSGSDPRRTTTRKSARPDVRWRGVRRSVRSLGAPVRRSPGGFEVDYVINGVNSGVDHYALHPKCLKAWERERINLAELRT